MHRLHPGPADLSASDLDDDALAAAYDAPEDADFWWRVNFVTSVDGAVTLHGRSEALSSAPDRRVMGVLRDLADVLVVGAGTARAESYAAEPLSERRRERRRRFGHAGVPAIAVVSGRLLLDPASPLFTVADGVARTVVLTHAEAPVDRRAALAEVADVVVVGEREVDLGEAARALRERGFRRVTSEGGPRLLRDSVAAGVVDELCLTVSALVAGPQLGDAPSGLLRGAPLPAELPVRLAHVLAEDDQLFLKYRFADRPPP